VSYGKRARAVFMLRCALFFAPSFMFFCRRLSFAAACRLPPLPRLGVFAPARQYAYEIYAHAAMRLAASPAFIGVMAVQERRACHRPRQAGSGAGGQPLCRACRRQRL